MNFHHTIIAALLCIIPCFAKKKPDELERKLALIEQLRAEYRMAQNDLQLATAKRWAARQRQVEKLERNRVEIEQARGDIDKAYTELARVREECLVREQSCAQEISRLDEERQRLDFLTQAVAGKLDKAKQAALTGFPLDRENDLADLSAIERSFAGRLQPVQMHNALAAFARDRLEKSALCAIRRTTILAEPAKPVTVQVLQIGTAFAYACGPDNSIYALTQSGRLGSAAFMWNAVNDVSLKRELAALFPLIIEKKNIRCSLPVDIMQNKSSRALMSGVQPSFFAKTLEFFKKGGLCMIPLAGIVLWAAAIIILRFLFYFRAHNHDYRFIHRALDLIEKGKVPEAELFARTEKGGLARILQTCLEHGRWSRDSAEGAVRELLLKEIPRLEKNLDTLAALAGAAPLLGLLGTVTGMISMFEAITRFGTADPQLLAGGISEALITTEVGLSIAIPLLLIHTLLSNTRNRIQSDLELYAMSILNRLWPEKTDVRAADVSSQ
jgi:biopolymer transport protein ExbB